MKKKHLLTLAMILMFVCIFAISASAAVTGVKSNQFGDATVVEGMTSELTDTTSKVVLINADGTYTTYPTYYVVPKLTWQSEPSWDFDNLNTATGESYSIASIIRVQIPTDATKLLTNAGNKLAGSATLVEVNFPSGTQITELVHGVLANCTALEKVNIPSSIETLNADIFRNCEALTDVTIEKGVPYIGEGMFNACSALTKIVMPNSVKYVNKNAFYNCTALKEIVFGAGLEYLNGESIFSLVSNVVFYIPETFYQSSDNDGTITQYNCAASYHTNQTLQEYVIYYTGTYDDAVALRAKFVAGSNNHLSDFNIVAYDENKTAEDYYAMDAYTDGANTSRVLVYGYNKCDAFYGKVHDVKESAYTTEDGNAINYFEKVCKTGTCERCQKVSIEASYDAFFDYIGYSKYTDGTGYAITQAFTVNKESIHAFEEATGINVEFGLVAGANGKMFQTNDLSEYTYDILELRIVGISDTALDTILVCGAYVTINDQTLYLDADMEGNAVTVEAALGRSYNQIT